MSFSLSNGWMDTAAAVVWILANALLLYAAAALGRRLDPDAPTIRLGVHTLVIYWAVVVGVGTLLGIAGALNGAALIAGVLLTSGGILLAARRWRLAAGTAGHGPTPRPRPSWADCGWGAVWATAVAFWAARVLGSGLFMLPSDYDTLMYHLPMIDQWIQAGSLYAPAGSHWSTPGNSELLGFWAVAPFSGDFLIALNNVPATLLLAFATAALCAELGLGRAMSHLTGLAVTTNFVIFNQLVDAKNDIAVASLLMACSFYGVRHLRGSRTSDRALGAVCLGLLAGVKFFALGYAAVALVAVAVFVAIGHGAVAGLRFALVWVAGAALWGGYWYARNAAMTGTPFYPLGIVSGAELNRVYPALWQSTFLGNGHPGLATLAIQSVWKMTGPCNLVACFLSPVAIGWLAVTSYRRRWSPDGLARGILAALIVGSALVLLVTPFAVEDAPGTLNQMYTAFTPIRYGLSFLCLTVVGLSVMLDDAARAAGTMAGARDLKVRSASVAATVLAGLTAAQFVGLLTDRSVFFPMIEQSTRSAILVKADLDDVLIPFVVAFMAADALLLVFILWPRARRPAAVVVGFAVLAGTAVGVSYLGRAWHARYAEHFDHVFFTHAFTRMDQAQMREARVYVLDYRSYPFFGSRRQYTVCNPFSAVSYREEADRVRAWGADLVVIRQEIDPPWGRYRDTEHWFSDRPDEFHPFDIGFFLAVFQSDSAALRADRGRQQSHGRAADPGA